MILKAKIVNNLLFPIVFLFLISSAFAEPKHAKPILITFHDIPDVLIKRGLGSKELGASLAQVLDTIGNSHGYVERERNSPQAFPEMIIGVEDESSKNLYSKIIDGSFKINESMAELELSIKDAKTNGKTKVNYSGDPSDINGLISQAGEKVVAQVHPYSYAVYLSNSYKFDEMLKQLEQMTGNVHSDDAIFAYNLWGIYFMGRGEYAHAIDKFEKAVELWPGYASAYMNMGSCYYDLGNAVKGSLVMGEAVSVNPKGWLIYDTWSNILYSRKEYSGAIEKCRKLIELRPSYAPGYNRMGLALSDSGKNQEALFYYQKATELNPDFDFAYNNWSLSLLDLKDFDEAEDKIKLALRIQPNSAIYLNSYGLVFLRKQRYREAIEKFEAALKQNPGYDTAQANLLLAKEGLKKK